MEAAALVILVSTADETGTLHTQRTDSPSAAVLDSIARIRSSPGITILVSLYEISPGELDCWRAHNERLVQSLPGPGLFLNRGAQDVVRTQIESDVTYQDHGVCGAGEEGRGERVYAVIHDDLPQPEMAMRLIGGNCPRPMRSFIGRRDEVSRLQDLCFERTLVTVVGPPGVGKSALTLHVARRLRGECPDGVWWFQVDDCTSFNEVLARISEEKGLVGFAGATGAAAVSRALTSKRAVVVLDGCDGLLPEVMPFATAILSQSTETTLVVTSRRPLNLRGEHVFVVDPLATRTDSDGEPDEIMPAAARMFYARAEEVGCALALSPATLAKVLEICATVDGLPIAIEMLAAALRHSTLDQVHEQLSRAFSHARPTSTPAALSPLNSAFEASAARLTTEERRLLSKLALFNSMWTVDSIAPFLQKWFGSELQTLHDSVHNQSWLLFDSGSGAYRMLTPVRTYFQGTVDETARSEHAQTMFDMLKAWAPSIYADLSASGGGQQLDRHYSDFVRAFDHCLHDASLEGLVGEFLQHLISYWTRRNRLEDAAHFCKIVLSQNISETDTLRATMMLGIVHVHRRDLSQAETWFKAALQAAQTLKHAAGEAAALCNLALVLSDAGQHAEALQKYRQGLAKLREAGDERRLINALSNAAYAAIAAAESGEGDHYTLIAQEYLAEASRLNTADPTLAQAIYHNLARLSFLKGDVDTAENQYLRAVGICNEQGFEHEAFEALCGLARVAITRGDPERSALMIGLAREILRNSKHALTDQQTTQLGSLILTIRASIGAVRTEDLIAAGQGMTLDCLSQQAISL